MSVIRLGQADEGHRVDVKPGDEVIIGLAENPTTGYQWQIDGLEGPLELRASTYELGVPRAIGSGGERSIRLIITDAGLARIALVNMRSWEGKDTATATFEVEFLSTP